MSRLNASLVVVLFFILLLIGGSICLKERPAPAPTSMPKEVQINGSAGACGSGVGLVEGDTLVLVLDGNPSTGYTWEVGFIAPSVLSAEGEPQYTASSNALGAGGAFTFRFKAVSEGEVALRMIYHRPFEKDASVIDSCEVNVKVNRR